MLSDRDIRRKVASLRKRRGSIYAPLKYFRGLKTLTGVERRYDKMLRRDYKPFPTDRGVKTRRSSYTQRSRWFFAVRRIQMSVSRMMSEEASGLSHTHEWAHNLGRGRRRCH